MNETLYFDPDSERSVRRCRRMEESGRGPVSIGLFAHQALLMSYGRTAAATDTNVLLLLQGGNDVNGGFNFLDKSSYARSIAGSNTTPGVGARHSTAQTKFNTTSIYLPPNGSSISRSTWGPERVTSRSSTVRQSRS